MGLNRMHELEKTLKNLGFSEITASVYLSIIPLKKATARQLAESVGIPRPSVYDHLKILLREGLILELEVENKKYFSPDDPKRLEQLLDEKMESLKMEQKRVKEIMPKLLEEGGGVEAKIKFFAGQEGFRRVLNDILWQSEKKVLVMWPYKEMEELAGQEYLQTWMRRRVSQDIHIRSIWPHGTKHEGAPIPDEETRVAPKGVNWKMGYIIYGDKTSFISSRAESYSFTVHSRDFAQLQRAQFELVWKSGKRV